MLAEIFGADLVIVIVIVAILLVGGSQIPKLARSLLPQFTKLPPEIAERVNIADVTLQNQVDVANLQAFIDLLYSSGEISEKLDAHRLVDATR